MNFCSENAKQKLFESDEMKSISQGQNAASRWISGGSVQLKTFERTN